MALAPQLVQSMPFRAVLTVGVFVPCFCSSISYFLFFSPFSGKQHVNVISEESEKKKNTELGSRDIAKGIFIFLFFIFFAKNKKCRQGRKTPNIAEKRAKNV